MLPFQPEPEIVLKARYEDAVRDLVDIRELEKKPEKRPGIHRKHVFDFYDGLRLIVSRDTDGDDVFTHYSASMHPDGAFDNLQGFVMFVVSHINELRSTPMEGRAKVFGTDKGIVHVMYDEEQPDATEMSGPRANPRWN